MGPYNSYRCGDVHGGVSPYLYLWGGRGIKELPSTAGESGGGNYLFIRDEELGSGCSGWEGSGDPHRCLWALLFYGMGLRLLRN